MDRIIGVLRSIARIIVALQHLFCCWLFSCRIETHPVKGSACWHNAPHMAVSPVPGAAPAPLPSRPVAPLRRSYRAFRSIGTRWMDNDVYGHVNNVVYYSWFDTAVNAWLIEQGVLDIHQGDTIGLVIETQCNYFAPLAFPQTVEAGLRVAHLGKSSVRYEVGLFAQGEDSAAASGHFVHVYVGREDRRPRVLPPELRLVLQTLHVPD